MLNAAYASGCMTYPVPTRVNPPGATAALPQADKRFPMIQARAAATPLKSKHEAAAAEATAMTVGVVEAGAPKGRDAGG